MNKVYEIVKDRLLDKLVKAQESDERFAWIKPWGGGCPWACNYVSEKSYRGINALLLDSGEYITFNQIREMKRRNGSVHLKKGASSYPVFFFKFQDGTSHEKSNSDEEKEDRKAPIFRYYRVFSIDDVEGVDSKHPYVPVEHTLDDDITEAMTAFETYGNRAGLVVEHVKGSSRAYYSQTSNTIRLPNMDQFGSIYDYLSTCFHEAVHSTAITLNRNLSGKKGSKAYAEEELVAEIGAAMLCAKYRIVDDRTEANTAAYLQGWISHLQTETGMAIVSAASKAQKACDLICNEYQVEKTEVA